MANGLDLQTDTAQKMAGKNPVSGERILTETGVSENFEPGFDRFSLTQEERKQYGIKDNEDHAWIRNPRYWEQHEMSDRAREWRAEAPREFAGGRRVVMENGNVITNGDLILVAKPKAEREREEAAQARETENYLETLESGDVADIPRWKGSKTEIERYREQQHQDNVARGLIGPTAGMDFDMVARQYGKDRIEKEMAFYRNGGRHVDVNERTEAFQSRHTEERAPAGRERTSVGYSRKVAENWPADMRRK